LRIFGDDSSAMTLDPLGPSSGRRWKAVEMATQVQSDPGRPILIAFDGSSASRQAILEVAPLPSGRHCVLLTVSTPGNLGLGQFQSEEAFAEERHIDAGDLDKARSLAEKGLALAASAGMEAEAALLQTTGPAWTVIIDQAGAIDAGLIAVGARNRHPIVDDILGSQTVQVAATRRCSRARRPRPKTANGDQALGVISPCSSWPSGHGRGLPARQGSG
jgi:nucleotide-binding universal stress UspA family protein